jgi:hypothetical protein
VVDAAEVAAHPRVAAAVAERHEHRRQVDARDELVTWPADLAREAAARVDDDERDPDRLLVGGADLPREQPVRAGVLAVVGGEHEDGVAELGLRHGGDHLADLLVDHALHERVHVRPALPVAVGRDAHAEPGRLGR